MASNDVTVALGPGGVDDYRKLQVLDLTNAKPVTVAIVDSSGNQISTFGGGTQYTEGDTDATITGTAALAEGAANALRSLQVLELAGSIYPLKVAILDSAGSQISTFGGGTQYTEGDTDATLTGTISLAEGAANTVRALQVFELSGTFPLKTAIVDGSGNQITSFGGGTQYTEDAASAADPVGTQLISRRRDSLASEVSADGDVIAVNSTSKGELYVKHVDAIPVTDNGGSLTVDGTVAVTQSTSPWVVSGTVAATQSGTWILGANSGVDIGDVTINNAAGASAVNIQDGGNSITVDGSVSITGAVDTELTTADLDTGAGTDTRAVVGLVLAASGGGLLVGSANPMPVSDNSGSLTVDNAGTFAVQAAQSGTWTVQPGNTANSTAWLVTGTGGTFPVTDSGGSLTVDGTVAVSSVGGTVAVTQSTSPWVTADNQTIVDNAGFTDGTSKVFAAGYIFDEVAGTALTENDAAAARIDSKRAQVLVIEDSTTRGTRAKVTQPNADNISAANMQGLNVVSANYVFDGANYDAMRGDQTGGVFVQGPIADNGVAAGNPVRIGGKYNSADQTYASGDIADFQMNVNGHVKTEIRKLFTSLSTLNVTYDDSPVTVTSASVDLINYSYGVFHAIVTEAGAATDIEFTLQSSPDNTNWTDYRVGPWVRYRFDDATIAAHSGGQLKISEPFKATSRYWRVIVTATGTDGAGNNFTVANAGIEGCNN